MAANHKKSTQGSMAARILAPVCGVMVVLIELDRLEYRGIASAIGILAGCVVVALIFLKRTDAEQIKRTRSEIQKGVWPLLNEVVRNVQRASMLELVVVGCSILFFLIAVSHLKIVWLSNLLLFCCIVIGLVLVVVAQCDSTKLSELKRVQGREHLYQYMLKNVAGWTVETRAMVGISTLLILYGLAQMI
jgi:hypothetical protein